MQKEMFRTVDNFSVIKSTEKTNNLPDINVLDEH